MFTFRSIQDRPKTDFLKFPRLVDEFAYDPILKKPVVVGHRDLISFIDTPREDCEVYSKLTRFSNGDLTALGGGSAQGIYTDVSGIPTDYNTIMNSVKRAHDIVNKSGKKSILDYLNSAFEQIRLESQPTPEVVEPPKNDFKKEPVVNAE